jgi:DNA-binding XRE family transcriptional regulator
MPHNPTVEEIRALAGQLRPAQILLLPFYHELANEIKNPDRVRIQTEYFWRHWAPKLGPTLAVLVITLRSYCYYNKLTKEKRDWCFPEQETLAREIGVSRRTVIRELQNPLASYFIRREPQYRYDPQMKKKMRTSDLYHVAMDDPVAPQDEGRLVVLAAERILRQRQHPTIPRKQAFSPKWQTGTQVPEPTEHTPPKWQIGTHEAVTKCARNLVPLTSTKSVNANAVQPLAEDDRDARLEGLAQDLAEELADRKSLGFYRHVVRRLPEPLIYTARSLVREAAHRGQIRRSPGRLFTAIIKRLAVQAGIALRAPRRPQAER